MNNKSILTATAVAMVGAVGGAIGFDDIAPVDESGGHKRVVTMPIVGNNEPTTNYYQKVYRVPNEKGKRTYSKIVTKEKADRLINGVVARNNNTGELISVPLKRTFVKA